MILKREVSEAVAREKLASASRAIAKLLDVALQGKIIGLVSGNFNVVHPGHLRLLKFASENCDFLVVAVKPDGPREITVPAYLRLEALDAISMVDYTVLLDISLESFIQQVQPGIIVKGREHGDLVNIEEGLVSSYGGRLIFTSGDVSFSSLGLLRGELEDARSLHMLKPTGYLERHGIEVSHLRQSLERISGLRVTVIGDLIVDSYVNCEPVGMSQEDPTIVVTPIDEVKFIGGAGIVAAHAKGLGAEVRYFGVVGHDDHARFAKDFFANVGVDAHLLPDHTRPTTEKKRFRAHGKTLLRVNSLRQHSIDNDLIHSFIVKLEGVLDKTDLLLFSDFNYGCLPQSLVDVLVHLAQAKNVMMAADSQASSQYADISRFKHMSLVTPTERECRLAVRDFEAGLVVVTEKLQEIGCARNVVVTLGGDGLIVRGDSAGEYVTDRLPSFNRNPVDVAGAGDSLFTTAALSLCAGADIWQSMYLGSIAAGCQVSRVGNTPLNPNEICSELSDLGA